MQIHFQHSVDKQQLPMVLLRATQRRFIQITICYLDGGFFMIVIVFVVSLEAQQRTLLMMRQHSFPLLLFFYVIYVHLIEYRLLFKCLTYIANIKIYINSCWVNAVLK